MTNKSKVDILNETFEFYGADPKGRRSVESDSVSCRYLIPGIEPKMCAVGRCLENPEEWADSSGRASDLQETIQALDRGDSLDAILKEEYRGHSISFWNDLQNWHDTPDNFDLDNNCVCEHGKIQMRYLLEQYRS